MDMVWGYSVYVDNSPQSQAHCFHGKKFEINTSFKYKKYFDLK